MAETGAAFAGEHSGHYYSEIFCADSGIIAALIVLEQMSLKNLPLSELRKILRRSSTGEINFEISDPVALLEVISKRFKDEHQDALRFNR